MAGAAWLCLSACLVHAVASAHGYSYIGCFIDAGSRDLPVLAKVGTVSPGLCNGWCGNRGQSYFGLQNSNECWCGNSYGRHGSRDSRECNARCTGDHSVMCGGAWRNSVYVVERNVGMRFMGCFVDNSRRDLPVLAASGSMRISRCRQLCQQKKYVYFGVQHGSECWCGNSYGRYGVKSSDECNKQCSGDRNARCGASWRNSVYSTGVDPIGPRFMSHIGDSTVKGQIQSAIKSQYSAFPSGVMCYNCLLTVWNKRDSNVQSKIFPVSQLDTYMRHYSSKTRSKVQVLKFGANAKTTFEDFHFSIAHSQAVRKSYIGVAKRVNANVHLGMISVDLVATLVPKYNVYRKKTCKKILWIKKCKTHTYQVRRGYHTSEVNLIDRAMRSETFRLYAEKSRLLTV